MTTDDTITAEPVVLPPRLDLGEQAPAFYQAMLRLDAAAGEGLEPPLKELVRILASHHNGCAYCLAMHTADARKGGELDDRLAVLSAWREASCFTARERAAFGLTEAMTRLTDAGGFPDPAYDEAAEQFDPPERAQLVALVTTINAWNRTGVTCRLTPGS